MDGVFTDVRKAVKGHILLTPYASKIKKIE